MPYPLLPVTPNWESPVTLSANVAQTQYGEAGVVQRQRKSIINNISDAVSFDLKVTQAEKVAIDSFLRANVSRVFRIPYYNGTIVEASINLYKCLEWGWTWEGENCWSLQAAFSQVRRLIA